MRLVITVPGPSQEIPLAALLILAQAIVIRIVTNYFDPLTAAACLLGLPLALWTAPGILSQGVRRIEALRRDLRWWHVLWALIFLSDLVFRIRDTNNIKDASH